MRNLSKEYAQKMQSADYRRIRKGNEFDKRHEKMRKISQKINDKRMNFIPKSENYNWELKQTLNPLYKQFDNFKKQQLGFLKNKIRNKNFYYKLDEKPRRTYGGMNVTATVYKNSKQGLKHIGETKWQTASYMGAESEVLNFLVKQKQLPKQVLNLSESSGSGSGYYTSDMREILGIKIRGI